MIKLCFIDTETTGLDPKKNGILEIGCIIEIGDFIDEFVIECSPFEKDEINDKALEVNRISKDGLFKRTPPKTAYHQFIETLSQHVDRYNRHDKFFFLAYNAPFDNNFLREFFLKNDDSYFGSYFFYPPIDVAVLAAMYLRDNRSRMFNFKLTTVAPVMGIDIDTAKAHSALYDTQIMRAVYYKVMNDGIQS
ncbi:3'-5' exonuclease [Candidatus Babeliales bacterium]|nr:3'-5' exonuclease [Candidatus Babeliales bacterium]